MAKRRANRSKKGLKLENKYIYLSFAAGLIYYLASYFKFPNSYGAVVSFILLTLLIMNFKKIDGLKIIICSLIISLITLAPSLNEGTASLFVRVIILLLNLLIIILMIFGLKDLKKWGFYLSIIFIVLGAIAVLINLIFYDATYFGWDLPNVIFNLKMIASLSFSVASLTFLIRFRKVFSSK